MANGNVDPKGLQQAVDLLRLAAESGNYVAESVAILNAEYDRQQGIIRNVSDTFRRTASNFTNLGISLESQAQILRSLGASEYEVARLRNQQLQLLRAERQQRVLLGFSTESVDKAMEQLRKGLPGLMTDFDSLWKSFKKGEISLKDLVREAGGVGPTLSGLGQIFGKFAFSAAVLAALTKVLSDLTLGAARTATAVEKAMPTLTYEQLAGGVTIPGGLKAAQDLQFFGKSLGYSTDEVTKTAGSMARLGLSSYDYTKYALTAQRTMGIESQQAGEMMRYMRYRVGMSADATGSELLRLREYAHAAGLPTGMLAESFNRILESSGGMNINIRGTSDMLLRFSRYILEGTVDFGNLVQGMKGLDPSRIVGFTTILEQMRPDVFQRIGGMTPGASPLTRLGEWFGLTTQQQTMAITESIKALSGQMGLSTSEQKGMTRLMMMQVPGMEQFSRFEPKRFDEMVGILSGGGKLDEKALKELEKAGTADKTMLDSAVKAAQHLAMIEDTSKAILGIMQKGVVETAGKAEGRVAEFIGRTAAWEDYVRELAEQLNISIEQARQRIAESNYIASMRSK